MGIASLCCQLVNWSARFFTVPVWADPYAAHAASSIVRIYQACLSRFTGRICLFSPSCSHRALTAFEKLGWNSGIKEIDMQLKRCGGNYTLCMSCTGEVVLTTNDGQRFFAHEVSAAIQSAKKTSYGSSCRI